MANSPSTENYMLGRGQIFFDRFDNGSKTYEMNLGNCPSFAINVESEKTEHYSSMSGLKVKDKSVILSMNVTANFTLDEINFQNLNLAFGGTESALSQGTGTNETAQFTSVVTEVWYDLGFRNVTINTLQVSAADKTGYMIDAVRGRVKFTEGGDIAAGETVDVDFDYAVDTSEIVQAVTDTTLTGQLRFVGDNSAGQNYEVIFWTGDLSASGEVGFISDDWATIGFTYDSGADTAGHPDSPYFTIIKL